MTAVAEDRTHPVEGALAELRRLLGQALAAPVWSPEDTALVEHVVQAGAVMQQAQALLLRLVGEADARQALLRDGAPSAQAWVRHRLRVSPGGGVVVRAHRTSATGRPRRDRASLCLRPDRPRPCGDDRTDGG